MKNIITTLFFLIALAASARATVIVGTDAGYLLDNKEEYLAARLGLELSTAHSFSHQIEIEIGYSDANDRGIESDVLPVTLNYRAVRMTAGKFGYYLGGGLGFARSRLEGVGIAGPVRFSDKSFAAQILAGITYQASPAASLNLGVRYLRIGDVNFGFGRMDIGSDLALSAGLVIRF